MPLFRVDHSSDLVIRGIGSIRSSLRISSESYWLKRHIHLDNECFQVSREVREAITIGKPVVALESTIYTHGLPYPENLNLASRLENLVRDLGGVPATIGILDGIAKVGLTWNEMETLISSAGQDSTLKVSRRDLAYMCGLVSWLPPTIFVSS